jgi:hypothetical protein
LILTLVDQKPHIFHRQPNETYWDQFLQVDRVSAAVIPLELVDVAGPWRADDIDLWAFAGSESIAWILCDVGEVGNEDGEVCSFGGIEVIFGQVDWVLRHILSKF